MLVLIDGYAGASKTMMEIIIAAWAISNNGCSIRNATFLCPQNDIANNTVEKARSLVKAVDSSIKLYRYHAFETQKQHIMWVMRSQPQDEHLRLFEENYIAKQIIATALYI